MGKPKFRQPVAAIKHIIQISHGLPVCVIKVTKNGISEHSSKAHYTKVWEKVEEQFATLKDEEVLGRTTLENIIIDCTKTNGKIAYTLTFEFKAKKNPANRERDTYIINLTYKSSS